MQTIELLGLPGVGKTTLLRALMVAHPDQTPKLLDLEHALCYAIHVQNAQQPKEGDGGETTQEGNLCELSQQDRKRLISKDFEKSAARFRSLALFVAQNPTLIEAVMRIERTRGDPETWAIVNQWMFNLFARYQYVREHCKPESILLLDEGFIGRVVSLFAYDGPPPTAQEVDAYLRTVPRPAGVLWLRNRWRECLTRLESREDGPPERMRDEEWKRRKQIMKQAKHTLRLTVCALQRLGVPVHRISTEQSLEDTVAACNDLFEMGTQAREK